MRTIPSPRMTKLMLEHLNLGPSDILMEIGTGSGEQTMAFEQTGAEIHTVELEPYFPPCDKNGSTVFLHQGDGAEGLPSHAPFTAIVATCGVEKIPDSWVRQLAEGGRLLAPIGDSSCQKLTLFNKVGDEIRPAKVAAYCRFQMLRPKPKSVVRYNPYGNVGSS